RAAGGRVDVDLRQVRRTRAAERGLRRARLQVRRARLRIVAQREVDRLAECERLGLRDGREQKKDEHPLHRAAFFFSPRMKMLETSSASSSTGFGCVLSIR